MHTCDIVWLDTFTYAYQALEPKSSGRARVSVRTLYSSLRSVAISGCDAETIKESSRYVQANVVNANMSRKYVQANVNSATVNCILDGCSEY